MTRKMEGPQRVDAYVWEERVVGADSYSGNSLSFTLAKRIVLENVKVDDDPDPGSDGGRKHRA